VIADHPWLFIIVGSLAVAICAALVFLVRFKRCPSCSQERLKRIQFVRATVLVDGRRAPDSWSYYECGSCGARFREQRGEYRSPTAEEWHAHVERHGA
jgi:transposase-like protein